MLPSQVLAYDTTFDCAGFYLSVFTFRQTEFSEQPTVPLIFMIHEYRTQEAHVRMMECLKKILPEIDSPSINCVLVTDEETAIVNASNIVFPCLKRFRCYIHAWKNIKLQLAKKGITLKDKVKTFKNDFYTLLNQNSEEDYRKLLPTMIAKWNNKVTFCLLVLF